MKSLPKLHFRKKKQLSERWNEHAKKLSNNSPFGVTTAGLQDFRAFSFPFDVGTLKTIIVGKVFKDIDLSNADLNNIVFKSCKFENCLFAHSILHNAIFVKCRFFRCFFPYTDFRAAGIGIDGTEFSSCEFVRPKLARISFHLVTFKNIEFDGRDWSRVNFGLADFWDCTFRGVFRNCEFQDGLMPKKLIELANSKRFGFHNVDLSAAEFSLAGFPAKWVFDNVRLPQSQSVKIVKAATLRAALEFYSASSQQSHILKKYLGIFTLNVPNDQLCFVSKHDLLDLGSPNAATDVFTRLSSASTSH
jgi:uncharacterized protein YjbI with pentapeptide repeats